MKHLRQNYINDQLMLDLFSIAPQLSPLTCCWNPMDFRSQVDIAHPQELTENGSSMTWLCWHSFQNPWYQKHIFVSFFFQSFSLTFTKYQSSFSHGKTNSFLIPSICPVHGPISIRRSFWILPFVVIGLEMRWKLQSGWGKRRDLIDGRREYSMWVSM